MQLQDGFIVNVSSYCDRWCARCSLTARCEIFAKGDGDRDETTAQSRADLLELVTMIHAVQSPGQEPHGHRSPPTTASKRFADLEPGSFDVDPAVLKNSAVLHRKRQRAALSASASVRLAVQTIEHFSLFVPVKMTLCLGTVLRHGAGPQQSEANGWGKAALLGLERMHAAWRLLVDTRHYSESDVAPFLAEIARMRRNLERVVPDARGFIRPGFDEMQDVAILDIENRMH